MSAVKMEQMKRELDATINQKLGVAFQDTDGSAADKHKFSMKSDSADIGSLSNFARFLTQSLCLEVLLFWKAVRVGSSRAAPFFVAEASI